MIEAGHGAQIVSSGEASITVTVSKRWFLQRFFRMIGFSGNRMPFLACGARFCISISFELRSSEDRVFQSSGRLRLIRKVLQRSLEIGRCAKRYFSMLRAGRAR